MPLHRTVSVKIEISVSESEFGTQQLNEAQLEIASGATSLSYSAGDRYSIESLISYGL